MCRHATGLARDRAFCRIFRVACVVAQFRAAIRGILEVRNAAGIEAVGNRCACLRPGISSSPACQITFCLRPLVTRPRNGTRAGVALRRLVVCIERSGVTVQGTLRRSWLSVVHPVSFAATALLPMSELHDMPVAAVAPSSKVVADLFSLTLRVIPRGAKRPAPAPLRGASPSVWPGLG